jgi:hypothetical protein
VLSPKTSYYLIVTGTSLAFLRSLIANFPVLSLTQFCRHVLSSLKPPLLPSLLKYVISDGEVYQTTLGSIHSHCAIHRQVVNVLTFASLMPTSSHPLALLIFSFSHHLTYEGSLPMELVLIFLGMPCSYGASQMLPSGGTAEEI